MAASLVQFRAFVLTVQTGKLTAAASQMGISQPTVSFHLSNLQKTCGQALFAGEGRGLEHLTPFGAVLYRHASQLVAVQDNIASLIGEARQLKQGLVRVGSTHSPATYFLPAVLTRFVEYYPNLDVSLDVAPSHVLLPKLLSHAEDLCLVNHFPSAVPEVVADPLYPDPLVAITAPDHPLAQADEAKAEHFATYKVIMHEPDSISRRAIDAWFQEFQVQPNVLMEVSSTETMKEMVRHNLGIAIVSRLSCARDEAEGHLVTRPVPTLMAQSSRSIYLVHPRGGQSPAAGALIDVIKAMVNSQDISAG